ncbi:MAG: hypothetical protein M3350_06285 [Actinomycetota bacterium]|nr:hypothetical protein [Actinomycetota bacterium]
MSGPEPPGGWHRLWRDLDILRRRVGLEPMPVTGYVLGLRRAGHHGRDIAVGLAVLALYLVLFGLLVVGLVVLASTD